MSLIFLRHSKPDAPDGLCYGRTDLAIVPGLDTIVARLTEQLPPIKNIVSSPLSRCLRLAQAIAKMRDLPISTDENLIEMDFGSWENIPWDAINREELDAWAADFFHARPHGGESVAMLQGRVRSAIESQRKTATLWVSHAGVYRALMAETDHPDPWNARIEFADFEEINIA